MLEDTKLDRILANEIVVVGWPPFSAGALNAGAALLASMLNRFGGLELKQVANIVRERWDGWLTLLIRAESFPHIEQYVCVARTSLDRSEPSARCDGKTRRHLQGATTETAPCLIPMGLLLRCLRGNAAKAGIELPEHLTANPNDKPAYAKWRAEIDALREAAGVRVANLAKPLAPA